MHTRTAAGRDDAWRGGGGLSGEASGRIRPTDGAVGVYPCKTILVVVANCHVAGGDPVPGPVRVWGSGGTCPTRREAGIPISGKSPDFPISPKSPISEGKQPEASRARERPVAGSVWWLQCCRPRGRESPAAAFGY